MREYAVEIEATATFAVRVNAVNAIEARRKAVAMARHPHARTDWDINFDGATVTMMVDLDEEPPEIRGAVESVNDEGDV